ncbi:MULTISPECIES: energy transducer TonB [unclassified Helicobacter]|uniref:energy transducer TonB n=1 Tax=unclassified Helicobacter TaxID=2593540 RepID=UPI002D77AF2E|nr:MULTISPECIES: energy transducer TonB [unclassified Helicobacter]
MMKHNYKRFYLALLFSLIFHCILVILVFFFSKTPIQEEQKKVKLENLLVLKRGTSQDASKNTQGSRKPSLSSQNKASSLPAPSKQTNNLAVLNKPSPIQKSISPEDNQKTPQENTHNQTTHFDPKNLSFLNQPQQILPQQNTQSSDENNRGRDSKTIQEINELYGEEFGDLGTAEKDFIRNNLRNIGRITQRYLTYPSVAAYFEQSGINAVEFYLHPNGDITDLKIIKSSGLKSFDSATLNTIKIAYKDYPRPEKKTLIRIKVTYSYFGF